LFDFDLTFLSEIILFLFFSVIVTFFFLAPISSILKFRTEVVNEQLTTASLLLTFGNEKLFQNTKMIRKEIAELTRQLNLVKNTSTSLFETEISDFQQKNTRLLKKLKGNLALKSSVLIQKITKNLTSLTDTFFHTKFQSR
jgi:F0F1-type ATP synthase membrane subunit b/b'